MGSTEETTEVAAEQPQVERSFERQERSERPQRGERRPRRERQPEPEAEDVSGALPSFLTNPVRAPAPAPVEPVAAEPAAAAPVEKAEEAPVEAEAPVKRTRRRRSPREVMDALGSEADGPAE